MKRQHLVFIIISVASICLLWSCEEPPIPKPRGYYRIELPKLEYKKAERNTCKFEILESSNLVENPKNKDWFSIKYPSLNGAFYFTYFHNNDIESLSEDGRKTAFDHAIRADEIIPIAFTLPEKNLYGLVYSIEGNAATPLIMMMTDSVDQFIHGTFYFEAVPNADSLRPATHFIRQDAQHIIETFEWSKYQDK